MQAINGANQAQTNVYTIYDYTPYKYIHLNVVNTSSSVEAITSNLKVKGLPTTAMISEYIISTNSTSGYPDITYTKSATTNGFSYSLLKLLYFEAQ